jgi:hypothetical protein
MNKPKHSLHLVAVATLALCSAVATVAQAAPTQAELDSIVLYGSTTIAKDSTLAWGVWEQIDPPAAGPQLPRIDQFAKAEWYRPLAQTTLNITPAVEADVLCGSGGLCGFGMFADMNVKAIQPAALNSDSVPALEIESPDIHPYWLTAKAVDVPTRDTIILEKAQVVRATWEVPAAMQVLSTVLNTGSFAMPDSGTLVHDGGGYYYSASSLPGSAYYNLSIQVDSGGDFYDAAAIQAAFYRGTIGQYVSGQGEGSVYQSQQFVGVIGTPTAATDMSALRASGATATYAGYDVLGNTDRPNVLLKVEFGPGIWSGSINGGADNGGVSGRSMNVYTAPSGKVLEGMVGVDGIGVIKGSEFISTGVSATDGTVKGSIRGAFFGPMAAGAGGVIDITKTRTDGTYTNARFVSPFLAVKGLSPTYSRGD